MPNGQQKAAGAIRPTLFIGLGGTGKEVLLRLRRKFYERLGEAGLPCVSYLWLDTDTKDHLAQGEPIDEIFRAVAFKELERVPLLQGKVKDHLSGVFLNKSQWDHIHPLPIGRGWLYPEVERFGSEISDGAGGVRAVGRLTFFHLFAETIDPRVRAVLQGIGTQEVIDATERRIGHAEFDRRPQVFLVASVAGGTGCGTFLDMVFLLRKLSREGIGIERVVSILFLPNIYYPTASGEVARRSYGNAYAALKELEFYTLRRRDLSERMVDDTGLSIDFDVEWTRGRPFKIQGPPFSVTYILERENEGDIGLETRSELFHMVAESLFLDFMPGEFSTAKRSHYSNVTHFLSGPEGHSVSCGGIELSQAFARRYASFGMSKVEIPIDLLKGACVSQLAHEIVKYWGREVPDPNIPTHVLEDMAQGEKPFDADGLRRRFGVGWQDTIRAGVEEIFRGVSVKETKHVDEIAAKMEDFERKVLREEGADPAKWGTVIASIRNNRPKVLDDLRQDLLQWLKRSLEDPSRGLKGVLGENGYLRHLTENLKAYYESQGDGREPEFERRRKAAERDVDSYKTEKEKNQRELKTALKSAGVAALVMKEWIVQTLMERLQDAEQQYALARAEVCLLEEAKKVAKGAVEFLEEKRPLLQRFLSSVNGLATGFHDRKKDYLDFGDEVLFIRFFDEASDWPNFYALDVDGEGRHLPVSAQQEHRHFLDQVIGAQATLWEVIELFGREAEKGIESRLTKYCEERFIGDFNAHPRDVNR
jgi:hypothetical protein